MKQLRELRRRRDLTQEQLAERLGVTYPTVGRWETGKRRVPVDKIPKLAAELGVRPGDLFENKGAADTINERTGPYEDMNKLSKLADNHTYVIHRDKSQTHVDYTEGYASLMTLDELDVRASAGPGAINDREATVARWSVPEPVVRAHTPAPADAIKIITIVGNSNVPDFYPGDKAVVDTQDRNPSPAGYFALWNGIATVIKMLDIVPGSTPLRLRLISKNPDYPPDVLPAADVHISGRVVAKWQRT